MLKGLSYLSITEASALLLYLASLSPGQLDAEEKSGIRVNETQCNMTHLKFDRKDSYAASEITPHKGIFGSIRLDDEDDMKYQIKIQGGFKYSMQDDLGLKFAYSMTGLWDIQHPSGPFRDINHNPEVFFEGDWDWARSFNENIQCTQIGYEHASNGVDNDTIGPNGITDRSRSVHNLNVQPYFKFSNRWVIAPKLWWNAIEDENEDIGDFYGNLDIHASYTTTSDLMIFSKVRGNINKGKGRLELNASYPTRDFCKAIHLKLCDDWNSYVFAEYFDGYGESLLTYNQRTSSFRIGIMLSRP
jgi:outer membrane phospholipase A